MGKLLLFFIHIAPKPLILAIHGHGSFIIITNRVWSLEKYLLFTVLNKINQRI